MASRVLCLAGRFASRVGVSHLNQRFQMPAIAALQNFQPLTSVVGVIQSEVNRVASGKRWASHFSHEQPPHTPQLIEDRIMLVLKLFDKVDPEILTPDSHLLHDLGLNSLDHVEVVMMLEEEFMMEFPDEHYERLYTARDFKQYIMDRWDVFEHDDHDEHAHGH